MHRWTRATRRVVTPLLVATAALFALPAVAGAEDTPPPPGGPAGTPVGLEIKSVNLGARTVTAVLHCTSPDKAGKTVTLGIGESVDVSGFVPGRLVGAIVDTTATPLTIVALVPPPCDPPRGGGREGDQPGGPGKPGEPGKPGQPGQPGQPGGDGGDEGEDFAPAFLSRVWKFTAEVDGLEGNQLSITIGKILNLPKRFSDEDDDLVDEDALVLIKGARIIDEDGERASKRDLDDAEDVRIHGKLLPESKWEEDEDDEPVPTIRAKKIYITG